MSTRPGHLAPSELGTKEYWDSLYAKELANHAGNPEDTGTVWFDDVDAEGRMVGYLGELLAEEGEEGESRAGLRIIDLGCGNGSLLRAVRSELAERDLLTRERASGAAETAAEQTKRVRFLGVDYSEGSIALAQRVEKVAAEQEGPEEEDDDDDDDDNDDRERARQRLPAIELAVWDILHGDVATLSGPPVSASPSPSSSSSSSWDVVLDKGTFDAISLGAGAGDGDSDGDADGEGRRRSLPVETLYRRQVLRLLRPGGRFLVTSCNWTEAELEAWMAPEVEAEAGAEAEPAAGELQFVLQKVGSVAYPSFQFGGQQGQAVCTVCFEKQTRR